MDVKTLCLGALSMGDASGYEIRKLIVEGPFSHFCEAGFGSIYPALNKLHADKLVTCTAHPQEKRPAKKVYALTPAGRLALTDALMQPPGIDKLRSDFLFVLFFGELLPARDLERLIDQRIAWYRAKVEHMQDCTPQVAGRRFVHGFGLALYQAAADYLDNHKHEMLQAALIAERPEAAD